MATAVVWRPGRSAEAAAATVTAAGDNGALPAAPVAELGLAAPAAALGAAAADVGATVAESTSTRRSATAASASHA